jgi:hypothetical protein
VTPQDARASRGQRADRATPGKAGGSRLAAVSLVLLALALHVRDLTIGFPDQDLVGLDTVLRTSLAGLLRGGALPPGFTPLSRELWLWWWGKTLALQALAFHLLGAAVAALCGWLIFRLGRRLGGAQLGWIAVALALTFPPLGAMLSSALSAREMSAVAACAAAMWTYARGDTIPAGALAGAAVLCGETAPLLPLVLLAVDLRVLPADSPTRRLVRLAPSAVCVLAALFWTASVAPWRLAPGAWRAPLELLSSWAPGGFRAGLVAAWHGAPWLLLALVPLAIFAVPARRSNVTREAGDAVTPGLALLVCGLVPLVFLPPPHPAEALAVPALGLVLAAGAGLARLPVWGARVAVAALALVSFGANNRITGAQEPFTSHARLGSEAARTAPALDALRPLGPQLTATPHSYVAGFPPDSAYRLVFGPGARVALHQPALSIRFLAELTAPDVEEHFGLLRYDPTRQGFLYERADAGVRARIGEGSLIYGRFEVAAACFRAAAMEQPENPQLPYPWVLSLAAAGQTQEARERWQSALAHHTFPSADTLSAHLLFGLPPARADSARRAVLPQARAAVSDPVAAAPHIALGRELLGVQRARAAAIELSAGCGIGKRSQDLYWLARAYDDMGSTSEALESYRAALAGGLDSTTYVAARRRFAELLRSSGPAALQP